MPLSAPILETDRLIMRPHVIGDFDAYAELWASPRAAFMGGPLNQQAAWGAFCNDIAQWSLFGFGAWAVDTKVDGKFVGQIALQKPIHFPEVELGWILLHPYEGQGLAHEATEAALLWSWQQGFDTLVSYISPGNIRSAALAKRLGAVRDANAALPVGETTEDTHVYRHSAPAGDGGMEAYA